MPGNLCEHCTGMCCCYLALPIDAPEDREEFDDIRWYLLHEGVSVFVEDNEWYLYVAADCRHLGADFCCGIYATRPRICRQYTTENCDYHSGEYGWEHHFTCPEHLDEYAREFFAGKRKRPTRAKASSGSNGAAKRRRIPGPTGARPAKRRKPSYADATADICGRPLPVLGVKR